MSAEGSAPLELEASLVVVGADPGGTARRVAELDVLAGRRLGPARQVRLRDVYLDLPGEPLLRAGRALRLRHEDDRVVVGLKGGGRPGEGPGVEREELEAPWGPAAVDVIRRIPSGGTPDPEELEGLTAAARKGRTPLPALREAGFHVLQDRETRRIRRRILDGGACVGELAVDEVEFAAAGRRCLHREVEVEAAGAGSDDRRLLEAAVAELEERFGDALRRWTPSKLATGLALAELLADGTPAGRLAPDGSVGEAAYDRVEALLEETGAGR